MELCVPAYCSEATMMRSTSVEQRLWPGLLRMANRISVACCAMSLVLPLSSISSQSLSSNACIAKLPESEFARVPVLIDTTPEEVAAVKILPAADVLAQSVGERIRKSLGGSEDGQLPSADSAVKWWELGGSVVVIPHRDGTFTWRQDTTALTGFMATGELHRIVDALSEAARAGDRISWPDTAQKDSAAFRLAYAFPAMGPDRKLQPLKVRVANPIFTIKMPWFKPAQMSRPPHLHFPTSMPNGTGYGIILDFVVDSTGRVDPTTISDVPPEFQPVGKELEFHRALVESVVRDLPSAQFSPALVGGCAISQRRRDPLQVQRMGIIKRPPN